LRSNRIKLLVLKNAFIKTLYGIGNGRKRQFCILLRIYLSRSLLETQAKNHETGTRPENKATSQREEFTGVYLSTFVNINDLIALSSMG